MLNVQKLRSGVAVAMSENREYVIVGELVEVSGDGCYTDTQR